MNFLNFRFPAFLFAFAALTSALIPQSAVADSDSPAALGLVKNTGFCRNGVWGGTRWPGGVRPEGLSLWGSFCTHGDDNVGRAESQDFLAPAVLNLFLAGYPGLPGRRLMLKSVQSGEERELTPPSRPGEIWQYNSLPVPPDWIGKRVRLIAEDQATGSSGWIGFSLPILTAWEFSFPAIDTSAPQGGFCPDGVYSSTKWLGGRPKGISTWGSFCASGDAGTGWAASPPINAGEYINLYLAGYPATRGLILAVENMQTSRQFLLPVPTPPKELWQRYHFVLPAEWRGQLIRVIAQDQATGSGGWLAFSAPIPPGQTEKVLNAAKKVGLVLLLAIGFLLPSIVVSIMATLQGVKNVRALSAIALLVLGATIEIYYFSGFWPNDGVVVSCAGLLAVGAIGYFSITKGSGPLWAAQLMAPDSPGARQVTISSRSPGQKWLLLISIWGLSAIAILPAIFHWVAPQPYIGFDEYLPIGFGYLAALAICYWIFRVELRRLSWAQTVTLVLVVILLTAIVNNLHSFNVDHTARNGFPAPGRTWQVNVQDDVIQLFASPPHSYRFLPNSIVRWMQLAHIDFESARDLYRLIAGLLLFYAVYKFARLYCDYIGAMTAMLFTAVIFPVSFENYGGQLTDPLSHLSFLLAFIFLETEEFALLLSTLVIGSLAKETVLVMAGYYVLFRRREKHYPLKAAALCVSSAAVYFGVRFYVLHGTMGYRQVSGVTLDHVWENWQTPAWPMPFLLTACALLPFLALGWKETPLSLKRQTVFLFLVLFSSSLFFSWLQEGRNFMPLVFVLAVVAGRYLSRQFIEAPKREIKEQEVVAGD